MAVLELKLPPVLITVIFALLMWLVSRLTTSIPMSTELRLTALLVMTGAGAFVGLAGVMSFRKARTTVNPLNPHACSSLVVSGIFRISRNPMYLALFLVLLGWGLCLANLYSLVLATGFVAYMNYFQIRPEERALEAAFGQEFLDYRRRVRRWL
jgi:protein-S-isoprenylcysteine O-methyltransferase Ste14